MSEQLLMTPAVTDPSLTAANAVNNWRLRAAAGALTVLAIAGCSSGPGETEPQAAGQGAGVSESESKFETACGEAEPDRLIANEKYGATDSLFPSLAKEDNSLLPANEALNLVREQFLKDKRIASIMDAYAVQTSASFSAPEAGTLDQSEDLLLNIYDKDNEAREEAYEQLCNVISELKADEAIAFPGGQGMTVAANRDGKGITGFETKPYDSTDVQQGYRLVINTDNANLSPAQKQALQELANMFVILKDGRLVMLTTFGPSSYDLKTAEQTTPVDIKLDGTTSVTVKPAEEAGEVEAGSKPGTTNNGGVKVGEQGCTTGKADCGGGSGTDTGNTGPTGPGTGPTGPGTGPTGPGPAPAPRPTTGPTTPSGGETTPPRPQPTQPPQTQTPTRPPTQEPTQEPTPNKTGVPCDENAGDVCEPTN